MVSQLVPPHLLELDDHLRFVLRPPVAEWFLQLGATPLVHTSYYTGLHHFLYLTPEIQTLFQLRWL